MDQHSLAKILNKHDGSIGKAAKHFGKHYSYIKYWVNKYNLPFKLKVKPINIDPKVILKVYANIQSTIKCGKHFGVSHTYIREILHKYNACNKPITYNVNHRFFNKSNENEAQMYWAGFIASSCQDNYDDVS